MSWTSLFQAPECVKCCFSYHLGPGYQEGGACAKRHPQSWCVAQVVVLGLCLYSQVVSNDFRAVGLTSLQLVLVAPWRDDCRLKLSPSAAYLSKLCYGMC